MYEKRQASMKRIESIDAIRGLSLFGILIVNILSFHAPYFLYGGKSETSWLDDFILMLIDIFVQASFYPLFALLFGIGIYMMYERQESLGIHSNTILIRRFIILSIIGMIHGLLLWYGDILLTYGVFGLMSLAFLQKNIKTLLKWVGGLLVFSTLLFTWMSYEVRNKIEGYSDVVAIEQSIINFRGSFDDIFQQNLQNWLISYSPIQWVIMCFVILPMFLIGIVIKKSGWIDDPSKHDKQIKRWIFVSFILFLVFKIGPYTFGNPIWLEYAQDVIGGSSLSLFYFLALLLLFKGRNLHQIRRILSNIGKISLSNYMFQSFICFVIFYGVGFNLYHQLNMSELMAIALMIYIFQLVISQWYIKKFYFGPFEWIYRTLTYAKRQPFVKEAFHEKKMD